MIKKLVFKNKEEQKKIKNYLENIKAVIIGTTYLGKEKGFYTYEKEIKIKVGKQNDKKI